MPNPSLSDQPVQLVVADAEAGRRLDQFLAEHFEEYSRVHMRRVITAGGVQVDGQGGKPSYRLHAGQCVTIVLPEIPRQTPRPENIPLDILHEDESIVVVNKRPGMVVHPARGHWSGTLASALAFHIADLSSVGGPTRPGIVHRLDRDTSGVIVAAKNDKAHYALARQFEQRTVEKEYFAILAGAPELDRDWIDRPIGVHPYQREKMAIRPAGSASRQAQSLYTVQTRFDGFASATIEPKTGRTHQIRVHLASIGCPVLCDRQYGGRALLTWGEIAGDENDSRVLLDRQALHARRLTIEHPETGRRLTFEAPLPSDLSTVLEALARFRGL